MGDVKKPGKEVVVNRFMPLPTVLKVRLVKSKIVSLSVNLKRIYAIRN